ncbi:hypothetical protein DsansV1_C13g0123101 [Dioscorea sansibarensis]
MLNAGVEDEEKWLAEGIGGIQHNAFYMHRALVRTIGFEQFERCAQVLRPINALRAPHLPAFSPQVLGAIYPGV